MTKLMLAAVVASMVMFGCSVNTQKCLEKEGFKNCDDLKEAARKAQGSDEAYRFLTIQKKCHCNEK